MTNRIQILPENLCNQIAAGEVVERPASVVKELVENAIDSGAAEIIVDIEQGGKRLVRVIDNGCGMGREDLFLSLERHATSKISTDADLFQLRTLGFRGEALPSIAAVSRMLLRSRIAQDEAGWELYLESGLVKRADAIGMTTGTVVEVRDLFFKMPARKKFLRRDETELGHVGDVVTKLAMARPDIGFRLLHHGRTLIEVYPGQSLLERVGSLLGRSLVQDLIPVDQQGDTLKIHGLLGTPAAHRATSGFIYTFINGRYIRDRVVQHAVLEGYRQLIPRGRYPIVVLFLDLDPELVDVNVHPTKHEVRFRQQSEIHDFLAQSIKNVLRGSTWLGDITAHPEEQFDEQGVAPVGQVLPQEPAPYARSPQVKEAEPGYVPVPVQIPATSERHWSEKNRNETPAIGAAEPIAELFRPKRGFYSSLQVLGQYHQSYLLCQDRQDLILIDQHAAHERIGFERLKQQWHAGQIESQQLLFPEMLELSHQEAAQLLQQLARLDGFGFEIEPFGGTSFVIKAVPQILHATDVVTLVRDVVAELVMIGNSELIEDAIEKIFILMACHAVVRANQALNPQEIRALLNDLDAVDFSAQCPHGRPVMHRLPLAAVERLFKRG
jgi:DNA mismatch repair protein MutL